MVLSGENVAAWPLYLENNQVLFAEQSSEISGFLYQMQELKREQEQKEINADSCLFQ